MKRLISILLIGVCTVAVAEFGQLNMSDLDSPGGGGGGSVSFIMTETGEQVLNMNVARDFKFGDFGIGMGLNVVIPEEKRPAGLNLIEFRYAEYDNQMWGVRYGLLSGVTFGYGMIMDNYNSAPGIAYFDQSKAGLKAYSKLWKPIGVFGMYAGTNIMAGRLTYDLAKVPVLDKPLMLGGTYVTDSDGVASGNTKINEGISAIGVDLGFNLVDNFVDFFAEQASYSNGTGGFATGLRFNVGDAINLKTEWRSFGANFVPGLFNPTYELAPTNVATYSSPAVTGYFFGLEFGVPGFGKLSVGYTDYEGQDAVLRGAVAFREVAGYSGVISYEQLVFSDVPYTMAGTIYYPVNMFSKAAINFTKIGDSDPTYSVSYVMNF